MEYKDLKYGNDEDDRQEIAQAGKGIPGQRNQRVFQRGRPRTSNCFITFLSNNAPDPDPQAVK
jgi:hypothetical protein